VILAALRPVRPAWRALLLPGHARQLDARHADRVRRRAAQNLIVPGTDPVPVWPHKNGTVRGNCLHPLYPSVPEAAGRNPALYELLVLFDAVRAAARANARCPSICWTRACRHERQRPQLSRLPSGQLIRLIAAPVFLATNWKRVDGTRRGRLPVQP